MLLSMDCVDISKFDLGSFAIESTNVVIGVDDDADGDDGRPL